MTTSHDPERVPGVKLRVDSSIIENRVRKPIDAAESEHVIDETISGEALLADGLAAIRRREQIAMHPASRQGLAN